MITLHFYLDTRAAEGAAPLKLAICKRGDTAFLPTGIRLERDEWDPKGQKVVKSPRRAVLNSHLSRMKIEAEDFLLPLVYEGKLASSTATEIKTLLRDHFGGKESVSPPFSRFYEERMPSTEIHRNAGKACRRVIGSAWDTPVDRIDEKWARALTDALLQRYSVNTTKTTLTRVKVVWHDLQRRDIVKEDPFREIRIGSVRTRRRDLTREEMRLYLTAPAEGEREAEALDFFALSFYLIAMNPADIDKARLSDIFNGRLFYTRSKTKKSYSVKVIPEARRIIERRSADGLLFQHRIKSHQPATRRLLIDRAERLGIPHAVTMYWARHTWASLAYELGISIELVSAALGHSYGAAVTMGYIDIKERQVDDVNRKVVDFVLGDEQGRG